MKNLKSHELPKMPTEVKRLISDGVYALYELENVEAKYVLYFGNGQGHCFLSSDGTVIESSEENNVQISDAVSIELEDFSDVTIKL